MNRVGRGLSSTVEVILYALRPTGCDTISGEVLFVSTADENERRRFGVAVLATPCRAEPRIMQTVVRYVRILYTHRQY